MYDMSLSIIVLFKWLTWDELDTNCFFKYLNSFEK